MSRLYMEDALDAIYDYFNSNLNTKLATIRTARSSNFPANIGYMKTKESQVHKFPKVTIIPDITEHNYAYEDKPLKRPWLYHNITVWIEHSSGSIDEVQETLLRYVEAINKLQEDDDTFDGSFVWVKIGVEDYTLLIENQKTKKMIQGVKIGLICNTI